MQIGNTSKWIKWAPRYYNPDTKQLYNDKDEWDYLEFPEDETMEDMRTHLYTFYVDEEMFDRPDFHGIDVFEIEHPPKEWLDEQILHFQRELVKNQTMLNHYEDWKLTLALEEQSEEED